MLEDQLVYLEEQNTRPTRCGVRRRLCGWSDYLQGGSVDVGLDVVGIVDGLHGEVVLPASRVPPQSHCARPGITSQGLNVPDRR